MPTPRGLSLNNPLNLKHSPDKWKGKSDYQPDASLVRFDSPEAGIRAAARNLLSYDERGFNTVAKIVTRWAPPPDKAPEDKNPTEAYIAFVAGRTGFPRDRPLDLDDYATMRTLILAMGRFEQDVELPYSDAQIMAALDSAGIHNVPKPAATPTVTGGTVAAIGTAATATVSVIQQGQDFLMNAPWIGDIARFVVAYQPKVAGAFALMIAAGVLYALWAHYSQQRKGI